MEKGYMSEAKRLFDLVSPPKDSPTGKSGRYGLSDKKGPYERSEKAF